MFTGLVSRLAVSITALKSLPGVAWCTGQPDADILRSPSQIVLFCLVAVALAQSEKEAQIIRQDYQLNEDGSFQSDVETSNNIVSTRTGQSQPGNEPETGSYTMSGEYSYTAPDGTPIRVTWVADEAGYRAESDSIPKV